MSELALNTEDDEERQRHLDEGEALLRSGAVAHNHVFFYRNAMDACLESEDWGGVERYGQTLWDFTRQEPLPICDFYIARGRSLAAHGRGERSQSHAAELRRLCEQAQEAGLMLALPELQAALADAPAYWPPFAASSAIFSSSLASSSSIPSRLRMLPYSERLVAISLMTPFRKMSMMRQRPSKLRSR